jgi:hypothetical protein
MGRAFSGRTEFLQSSSLSLAYFRCARRSIGAFGRPLNFRSHGVAATLGLVSALSGQRRLEALQDFRGCLLIAVAVAMATANAAVMAANFGAVRYDPTVDQLIVTMIYDGTKPNHRFSVHWGDCRKGQQIDRPAHQTIAVDILDDDHADAAMKHYTETLKVPLANLSCRPATVTVWTPPNFDRSIDIPARP